MNTFEQGYKDTMEKIAFIGLLPKGVGAYQAIGAGREAANDPNRSGFWEGAKAAAPFTGGFSVLNALWYREKVKKALQDPVIRKQLKQARSQYKAPGVGASILAGLLLGTLSTAAFGGIPGALAESKRLKELQAEKASSLAFAYGYHEAMEKVAMEIGARRKGCLPEELLPNDGSLLKKLRRQRMQKRL